MIKVRSIKKQYILTVCSAVLFIAGCSSTPNKNVGIDRVEDRTTAAGWHYQYVHIPESHGYKITFAAPSDFHYLEKNPLVAEMSVGLLQISGFGDISSADKKAAFESLSSNAALSATQDSIWSFVYIEEDEIDTAAKLFAGTINAPRINADDLASVKENYINNLKQQSKTSIAAASSILSREILGDSPFYIGRHLINADGASAVELQDVEHWLSSLYKLGGIKIGVAGKSSPSTIEPVIDQLLENFKPDSPVASLPSWEPNFSGRTIVLQRSDVDTALFLFEGPWPKYTNGLDENLAYFAAIVIGGGDQSRLSRLVRDELRASYAITAGVESFDGTHNGFAISGAVDIDRQAEVFYKIKALIDNVRANGISEDEFNRVKALLENNVDLFRKDENAVSTTLVSQQLRDYSGGDIFSDISAIKSLTYEQVNEAVKASFPRFEDFVKVIVTPAIEGLEPDCVLRSEQEQEALCAQ